MVDGGDTTSSEKTVDVARSIVIAKLSNAMYSEPSESFNNIIYALLEKTFNMSKDAVERIIKYPHLVLESEQKDFACKCLISFRSRVHKHRVIAQQAKLEAPTTVETITQIPKEILEVEDELEIADEYAGEDEELMNNDVTPAFKASLCTNEQKNENTSYSDNTVLMPCDKIIKTELESDPSPEMVFSTDSSEDRGLTNVGTDGCAYLKPMEGGKFFKTDQGSSTSPEEKNMESKKDGSENLKLPFTVENKALKTEIDTAAESELVDNLIQSTDDRSGSCSVTQASESALKTNLSPLCKIDNHKEHFKTLPISWDGAPEFQWRTVHNSSDRRTLIIENICYSDIANIWLYPAVVRASDLRFNFERQGIDVKDPTGKMELKFADETVVSSCAINYLVHVRTSKGRRLKIFLPQTKTAIRLKGDLEERLGRVREPNELMHQLIVKPVEENITEDDLVKIAFSGYTVKCVEFKVDALGQRCAIVTFENANTTVAAHLANEFVQFGNAGGAKGWYKVFYPYAMMRHSGADGLLTKAEYKKFVELEDKKPGKDREDRSNCNGKSSAELGTVKLNKVLEEADGFGKLTQEPRSQIVNTLTSKEQKEPVKQKGLKRSFPHQNRGSSAKKSRRTLFGIRKCGQMMEPNRRLAPMPQGLRNRRNNRGKRGSKRQQHGGVMTGQGSGSDWGAREWNTVNGVAMNHDNIQPTPLLTREDYEALQNCAPMKNHSVRTFPKKGKQRHMGKQAVSHSLANFNRLESGSQLHIPRFPHIEREDDAFLIDGICYDQRESQYMGSERGLRRRPEDLEYSNFGRHDGIGYGNPSSSLYFNRTSGSYLNDGYDRDLGGINDFSRPRPYDVDPLCDNRWNSFDDYSRGEYSGRRNVEYNNYDRSRQTETLPYGSAWR